MYHDVGFGLGCLAGHGYVGDDGQLGEPLHVIVALDAIAEELEYDENNGGDGQAKNQSNHHDEAALGADLAIHLGHVNELPLVGCGCKRDGVLLALLQQHQVETRLHLLLAAYLAEHALLLGSLLYLVLILALL